MTPGEGIPLCRLCGYFHELGAPCATRRPSPGRPKLFRPVQKRQPLKPLNDPDQPSKEPESAS